MNKQMETAKLKQTIEQRLVKLAKVNTNLYEQWVNVFFDSNGKEVECEWTSENLNKMESDILAMAMLFVI
jgi:hypothetical protein